MSFGADNPGRNPGDDSGDSGGLRGTDGTFPSTFELLLTLFPLPFRRKIVPVLQNTVDKLAIM